MSKTRTSGDQSECAPMLHQHRFRCPLPNGLHARPASHLADVASPFSADITLVNERSGAVANTKSVLSIVAADVKLDDPCELRVDGLDSPAALAALRDFVANILPGCDEPLPVVAAPAGQIVLPPGLKLAAPEYVAGTPVSRGIGQGTITVVGGLSLPPELAAENSGDVRREADKVQRALVAVRTDLQQKLAAGLAPTETGIFKAHLALATDVALRDQLRAAVQTGCSAGQAILKASEYFTATLAGAASAYVRERALDVQDICLQLLEQVYGERFNAAGLVLTAPAIVVAESLTPRQLLALERQHIMGLVLAHAGTTSHTVILARAFNIPTLAGVPQIRRHLPAGRAAILDANLGLVIADPSPAVQRYYERELATLARRERRFAPYVQQPAKARDGHRLEIAANITTAAEVAPALAQGAEGIGLFRTEMLFLDRDAPPSEEEQFAAYVQAAQAARWRPVIIRTIDIGGDKPAAYLHLPAEANPFLGYRGVRIYAEFQELFRTQLRAIARASAFGQVRLMVPMVAAMEEVRWVKQQLAEVQAELRAADIAYDAAMKFGIMLEVPSAAFLIDQLCAEVDFFSLGTNDLTQYFLAADRDNPRVGSLYSAHHPAFLRLLAMITSAVHHGGAWVGLCGEMGRHVENLPLLVALGFDEISVAPPDVLPLKAALAQLETRDCYRLLDAAVKCGTVAEVDVLLRDFRSRGVGGTLLDRELMQMDSDSASKEEVIKELVDTFYVTGRTEQPRAVEDTVWAREAVYSTGLGHGFAIPHCKTDAVAADSIGVARLRQPIAWGSVDGEPVRCVILLAMRATGENSDHMNVFSRLARKLMHEEFRAHMLAETDPDALLTWLRSELAW